MRQCVLYDLFQRSTDGIEDGALLLGRKGILHTHTHICTNTYKPIKTITKMFLDMINPSPVYTHNTLSYTCTHTHTHTYTHTHTHTHTHKHTHTHTYTPRTVPAVVICTCSL